MLGKSFGLLASGLSCADPLFRVSYGKFERGRAVESVNELWFEENSGVGWMAGLQLRVVKWRELDDACCILVSLWMGITCELVPSGILWRKMHAVGGEHTCSSLGLLSCGLSCVDPLVRASYGKIEQAGGWRVCELWFGDSSGVEWLDYSQKVITWRAR